MLDLEELCARFGLIVKGVVHVGANDGAEYRKYARMCGGPIVLIEAIPAVFEILKSRVDSNKPHFALEAVCSDKTGEAISFNVASNNGQSSSMFELGKHADLHPDIKYKSKFEALTIRLDHLAQQHAVIKSCNVLVIDTQGADLNVLRGSTDILPNIDAVLVEASEEELYVGGCTFDEIYAFMRENGFSLRALHYYEELYGDAFFMRTIPKSIDVYDSNLARSAVLTSSSVYGDWTPAQAVNGDRNQEIGFHSMEEDDPWWMADFGIVRKIKVVTVVDRRSYEYRGAKMLIESSEDGTSWTVLADRSVSQPTLYRVFQATGLGAARFIRVRIPGRSTMNVQQIIIT